MAPTTPLALDQRQRLAAGGGDFAVDLIDRFGVPADAANGARHVVAQAVANRFAGVQRFQQRQLFVMLLHQIGEAQQRGFALRRGGLRPVAAFKDGARRADRPIDVGGFAARNLRQLTAPGGIFHGEKFPRGGRLVAAVDKQPVLNLQGLRPLLPILQMVKVHAWLR